MSKNQKLAILIALVGGNVFLFTALRYSAKTIGWLVHEYSKLYDVESTLARKIDEYAPQIWEDEEVINTMIGYQFLHIVETTNLKEK